MACNICMKVSRIMGVTTSCRTWHRVAVNGMLYSRYRDEPEVEMEEKYLKSQIYFISSHFIS
jgi:hypothetical protein